MLFEYVKSHYSVLAENPNEDLCHIGNVRLIPAYEAISGLESTQHLYLEDIQILLKDQGLIPCNLQTMQTILSVPENIGYLEWPKGYELACFLGTLVRAGKGDYFPAIAKILDRKRIPGKKSVTTREFRFRSCRVKNEETGLSNHLIACY